MNFYLKNNGFPCQNYWIIMDYIGIFFKNNNYNGNINHLCGLNFTSVMDYN